MTPVTSEPGFSTRAIHAGQDADPATGATVVPIYATSTFTQEAPGPAQGLRVFAERQPDPDRAGNLPGGARGGRAGAGLCLGPGGHDRRSVDSAARRRGGGRRRSLRRHVPPARARLPAVGPGHALHRGSPARGVRRRSSARPPKLVWIETPTNPLLQIIDIAAVAELAHSGTVRMLAVDNTFASPYLQQPLELGADLVVHSTTKYLGGHSDVIGGAVIGRRETAGADRVLSERRRRRARPVRCLARACAASRRWRCAWNATAQTPGSWRRGLRASRRSSAFTIPGLPDHPGHELARRQMQGLRRHDQHPAARGRAPQPSSS